MWNRTKTTCTVIRLIGSFHCRRWNGGLRCSYWGVRLPILTNFSEQKMGFDSRGAVEFTCKI